MTGTVDDRIVSMNFDNARFEQNIAQTIASLDKLSQTIQLVGAKQGLTELSSASQHVDLSSIANGVDSIRSKFSAMGAVAFTVLQGLTTSVMQFAKTTVTQDFLGPIITGGKSRATNIEQAKFMFRGLGIDVEAGMQSALDAVRGTAFGLDEAAKAAAQFGASGIKVGAEMTGALRGVAGAAAMTGTSFTEMADIFASSAGSGKVNNQDLMQFATRGLNAAAAIAPILGKTEAQVHEMATAGTLDFKTFANAMDQAFGAHATQANETYTGSLANMHAALSRIGASFFTPRMEQQRDLFNALTPVLDKLNQAVQPLIQSFLKLTGSATTGFIAKLGNLSFDKFFKIILLLSASLDNLGQTWLNLKQFIGGAFREIFPKSDRSFLVPLVNGFRNLTEHLKVVGPTLVKVADIFGAFFAIIHIGWSVLEELFHAIAGVVPSLGGAGSGVLDFVDKIAVLIINFDKMLTETNGVHNFFVNLGKVVSVPIAFIIMLKDQIASLFGISSESKAAGDGVNKFSSSLQQLSGTADKMSTSWDRVTARFHGFVMVLKGIVGVLAVVGKYIATWFSELGQKLADAFQPGDFNSALDLINVGLLGGLVVMFKKFVDGGALNILSGDLVNKIKQGFGQLTGTLKAMQTELKAEALEKIAIAIGVLTASLVVLSLINSADLTKALTAMTVGFGELIGTMTALDKIVGSNAEAVKMGVVSAALIEMASAMVIFAAAVKIMASMNAGELAKGLGGIAVGLGLLIVGTRMIAHDVSGLVRAGFAMGIIAGALWILSKAVKSFASMSWGDMAKGLVGVAGGLAAITLAMNFMPASSVLSGAGMIEIAIALNILAGAVKLFSLFSWADMAKGLVGIGGALLIVAGAMQLMPINLPITATGILILSVALNIMAKAVQSMGSNDLGTLARGIGAFAIMLGILAAAMYGMSGALPGAAALVVVSGALLILTHVLKELGKLSIKQIAIALGAIAGVLLVLGVAAALLQPLIPAMMGLGVALAFVGAAFALFGIGALAIAKAFEIMAASGADGARAIVEAATIIINYIPEIFAAVIKSIIENVSELLSAVPLLIRIIGAILLQLLETVIKLAPKFAEALVVLITHGLAVIRATFPDFIQTGYEMLLALMKGLRDHIADIITTAVEIMVQFAASLVSNMPALVTAGVQIIAAFLQELANHAVELVAAGLGLLAALLQGIADNIQLVTQAVANLIIAFMQAMVSAYSQIISAGAQLLLWLLKGISDNILKVVDGVANIIVTFIGALGTKTLDIIAAGFKILTDLLQGISDNILSVVDTVAFIVITFVTEMSNRATDIAAAGTNALINFITGVEADVWRIENAATTLAIAFVQGLADNAVRFANGALDALISFLNGLADAIRAHTPDLQAAGWNVAMAVLDGFTGGLASKLGNVKDGFIDIAKEGLKTFAGPAGFLLGSPSKKTFAIGQRVIEGFVLAFTKDKTMGDSASQLASKTIDNFHQTLSRIPEALANMSDFNPTITPVLDLTKVQKESSKLASFMTLSGLSPDISIGQARLISSTTDLGKSTDTTPADTGPTEIKFEQNNYSPTALRTADIYRHTKSQVAMAKEELKI